MVEKIRWSPRAINNLDSICAYIAKDSKFYAAIFAGKILNLIDEIHRHPKAGRIVPEYKNSNLRERIYKGYRIVYRLKGNIIEIVAITHGAMRLRDIE